MAEGDTLTLEGGVPLRGRCHVPGEKGISHRALLFAALADGVSTLSHVAPGDDVGRTIAALTDLGVELTVDADARGGRLVRVTGRGVDALRAAAGPIDCGNSGTTMRMLAGLLAGRPFASVLTGDASLRRRPMARVVEPLRALGARITGPDDGARAPLTISPATLTGTRVELSVASGQVKTALVLAGLQADGVTEIVEPAPSRDHTERLLVAIDAPVTRIDDRTLRVTRGAPRPFDLEVPGDPSSAAFLVVAAAITPGSEVVLEDVLLNPGRIEFVDVLARMGAAIEVAARGERLGEPVGDLVVRASALHGTTIECTEPTIDEVPALAVAATFASGTTEISGIAELRVKESDRVATVEDLVRSIGGHVEVEGDRLVIHGATPHAATIRSHGDHRIALAGAVAASAVPGTSTISGWRASDVSYPGFAADLAALRTGGSS